MDNRISPIDFNNTAKLRNIILESKTNLRELAMPINHDVNSEDIETPPNKVIPFKEDNHNSNIEDLIG